MDGHIERRHISSILASLKGMPPIYQNEIADGKTAGEDARLTRRQILLVEDYPANLLVATTYLEDLGYEYVIANNGKEAVEKHANAEFAVILMDIQMPEMDGYEATKIIRDREAKGLAAVTPIIAMTSHARIEDRQKCMAVGMDDYISKPFREEELKKVIEKFHSAKSNSNNG